MPATDTVAVLAPVDVTEMGGCGSEVKHLDQTTNWEPIANSDKKQSWPLASYMSMAPSRQLASHFAHSVPSQPNASIPELSAYVNPLKLASTVRVAE